MLLSSEKVTLKRVESLIHPNIPLISAQETNRNPTSNQVIDLKGSIRVLCRVRPLLSSEKATLGGVEPVKVLDTENVRVNTEKGNKEFEFDRVFTSTQGQSDVFSEVRWRSFFVIFTHLN
jgi:hypothetical protein